MAYITTGLNYGNTSAVINEDGNITFTVGDNSNVVLISNAAVVIDSNILPDSNANYNLGSQTASWSNIYGQLFVAGDISFANNTIASNSNAGMRLELSQGGELQVLYGPANVGVMKTTSRLQIGDENYDNTIPTFGFIPESFGSNGWSSNTASWNAIWPSNSGSNGQFLTTNGNTPNAKLTWTTPSFIANGNSNVSIPAANGNINFSVAGNSNIAVIAGNGFYVTTSNLKVSGGANGQVLQTDGYGNLSWSTTNNGLVGGITGEPTGFPNVANTRINYLYHGNGTISGVQVSNPNGGNIEVWVGGQRFEQPTANANILPPAPSNTHVSYVYFNSSGQLTVSADPFNLETQAPVAELLTDGGGNPMYILDRRSGVVIPWAQQVVSINTVGPVYANGLAITANVLGDGNNAVDAQFSIAAGNYIIAEDIVAVVPAKGISTGVYTYGVSPAFDQLGKIGFTSPNVYIYPTGGNGRPYWSNAANGWSYSEIDSGNYGAQWVVGIDDVAYSNNQGTVMGIVGQAQFTSIGEALNFKWIDMQWPANVDTSSFRPLYKIVFQTNNSYTNAVKVRQAAVQDWRSTITVNDSEPITTNAVDTEFRESPNEVFISNPISNTAWTAVIGNFAGNINYTGANVTVGAVANLHITGGSNGQVLRTNGSGGLNFGWANRLESNVNANVSMTLNSNGNIIITTGTSSNLGRVSIFRDEQGVGNTANLYVQGNIVADQTDTAATGWILAFGGVDAANLVVGSVGSNLLPNANITYDLGSNTQRWRDIWLANSTIHLGETSISANANSLTLGDVNCANLAATGSLTGTGLLINNSGSNTRANFNIRFLDVGDNEGGQLLIRNTGSGANTSFTASGQINPSSGNGSLVGNWTVSSALVANGNITGGNLVTGGVANITGNLTAGNITTTAITATGNVALSGANVSLGAVGNLHVTGGSNNQILKTDGSGNLTWANSTSSSTTIANDASPSALPLINQVQILSYDAGNIEYTLADGYEGQLMHFVATPSDVYYPWSVNILCKGRYINANTEVVTANGNWYPWLTGYNNFIFSSYAIFAGNAWNFGSGEFTPA